MCLDHNSPRSAYQCTQHSSFSTFRDQKGRRRWIRNARNKEKQRSELALRTRDEGIRADAAEVEVEIGGMEAPHLPGRALTSPIFEVFDLLILLLDLHRKPSMYSAMRS